VREQILSLPAETLICPGHGPLTTVAEEKNTIVLLISSGIHRAKLLSGQFFRDGF